MARSSKRQRSIVSALVFDGTQYADAALSFAGAMTIVLDDSLFRSAGEYVLFDYSGAGASFPGGQAELNANITVDASELTQCTFIGLRDNPTTKQIILSLGNAAGRTDGIQYVDANLVFGGYAEAFLDAEMFCGAGTFPLYEVTGMITGLENLYVFTSISGLNAGRPYVSGSRVLVDLTA